MKLLRVLETGRFERLGSNREHQVKVRVISATNADLHAMIRAGTFREDLYYRLNTIEIRVPPLAERVDDILPLARSFLAAGLAPGKRLSADAREALRHHSWPGNVRELRNALQRAALLATGPEITAADLALSAAPPRFVPGGPGASGSHPGAPGLPGTFDDEPDRAAIEAALARAGGVIAPGRRRARPEPPGAVPEDGEAERLDDAFRPRTSARRLTRSGYCGSLAPGTPARLWRGIRCTAMTPSLDATLDGASAVHRVGSAT